MNTQAIPGNFLLGKADDKASRRFDAAAGAYWFYNDYHTGQWSDEYAALCRLDYHPASSENGRNDLGEDARAVYDGLVNRREGGLGVFVSVHGDGSILDACFESDGMGDLCEHCEDSDRCYEGDDGEACDEYNEHGDCAHTCKCATFHLKGVPSGIAHNVVDYARGGNLIALYSDGYDACEVFDLAKESKVLSCDVSDFWTTAECKRLGGCFLCGGMHDE